jgi:hypothetical protein
LRFFSPPEKPSFSANQHRLIDVEQLGLLLAQLQELDRVELLEAVVLSLRVERGLEEVGVGDAGDLDRVLKRHEHALAGALVGIHPEKIAPLVGDRSVRDLVFGMPREGTRERALAGSIRAHDGVHFAGLHVEIDPVEDLLALGTHLQILDIEH